MEIRKAKLADVHRIHELINHFAQKGNVLPRSLNYIYENLRDYWVAEEEGQILGCVALHITWEDLAEIKSLVVVESHQKRGIGRLLLERAMREAEELGVKRLFVLTYIPEYFLKFGFKPIRKADLPHKIWAECINCPKFPDCGEEALVKEV